MLVGITGTSGSGRKTAVEHLEKCGFQVIPNEENAFENIVEKWQENFVVLIDDQPGNIRKRPWFLHLNLDALDSVRLERRTRLCSIESSDHINGNSTEEKHNHTEREEQELQNRLNNARNAHINLINNHAMKEDFHAALDNLNICDQERVRPSWDRYFMTLADLAAQRSNCMKRRVGCVLVHENRIVSTGYNGTPRGSRNCNEGGCERCNSGSKGGTALATCLCLHAEENALLEAGRSRTTGSVLYCNTCPCLTCSIKIVQTGVSEVIYSQEYSMDHMSAQVLQNGGVKLRKYTGFI